MSPVMLQSSHKASFARANRALPRAGTKSVCRVTPQSNASSAARLQPVLLASVLALNGGALMFDAFSPQSARADPAGAEAFKEGVREYLDTGKQALASRIGALREAGDKADKCQSNEPPCKSEEAAQMVESTPPALAEVAEGEGKVKTVSPTAIIPDSAK